MGYMDLLKSAMAASSDDSQKINQDGKNYDFTPGPNGSLTAPANESPKPLLEPKPLVAKTVPIKPAKDVSVQTAAVRG